MRACILCLFLSVVTLLGCVTSKGGEPVPAGAHIPRPNVTVTRLGCLAPELKKSDHGRTAVAAEPVVLWSTHGAPAVLYVSESTATIKDVEIHLQEFAVLDQGSFKIGGKDSPFPIVHTGLTGFTNPDGVKRLLVADLDGDGQDELITIAQHGSVEVYGAAKKFGTWNGTGRDFIHRPNSIQTARISGKDIVHIAMQREQDRGSSHPVTVLRLDKHGITEVRLDNLGSDNAQVRSVAAISRPDSLTLDEIVVAASPPFSNDLFLSRHDPHGHLLNTPRLLPNSFGFPPVILFLPQNDAFIMHDFSQIVVVRPAATNDWLTPTPAVRCHEGANSDERMRFLGVMDPGPTPKLLVACEAKLIARDLDCRPLARTDSGWQVTEEIKPFYAAPPPQTNQQLGDILLEREGKAVLLVYTRKSGFRPLAVDEIASAADKFLRPERRQALGPSELEAELTRRVYDSGDLANRYSDIPGLTRWLTSVALPALTTFVLVCEGTRLAGGSCPDWPGDHAQNCGAGL